MANSNALSTPTQRARLAVRHRPYWIEVTRGVRLGYRKADAAKVGVWYGRTFSRGRYMQWTIGAADDSAGPKADGLSVLTHKQAVEKANRGKPSAAVVLPKDASGYTIKHAVAEYVEHLRTEGRSADDAEKRLNAYVVRRIGSIGLAHLSHDDLSGWRSWALKYNPPGRRDWAKYVRRSADARELAVRYKEAREYHDGPLPARVEGAHERRDRELKGLVKVRRYGPQPTNPPRAPKKVSEPAEVERRKKETVARVINDLKALLNFAFDNRRVASKEAWARLQRWRGTGSARVRWLTLDESTRLLNSCDPIWRKAVEGGLATGARWSEIRRSRVRDFDLVAGKLLIPRSKSYKARHIPLNDEGRALFESLTAGRSPGEYIFIDADGSPYGSHDQNRPMEEASAHARLDPPATYNVLRHTYASHLVQAGVALIFVAHALGHGDTRMVEKHYGHLAPSNVTDAVRANLPKFGLQTETNVRRIRA